MKKDIGIERFLIKHYSRVVTKNPHSLLFFPLANSFKMRGNHEMAIEICQNGLRNYPDFIAGRALLGELYFLCGRYKEAVRELKAVSQASPENILAKKLLIEIYLNSGMRAEAAGIGKELAEICSATNSLNYIKSDIKRHIAPYQHRRAQDTKGRIATASPKNAEVYGNHEADDPQIDDRPAFKEIGGLFSEKSGPNKNR